MSKTVLFQTIQFSIQKHFHFKQFSLALVCSLNVKRVLFQAIQFSIITQFSSIWPIHRTLSGATTGSDVNKRVLSFPQGSSITGTSPSDCLVSYPGHALRVESYPSVEVQTVYSTALADWAMLISSHPSKYKTGLVLLNFADLTWGRF